LFERAKSRASVRQMQIPGIYDNKLTKNWELQKFPLRIWSTGTKSWLAFFIISFSSGGFRFKMPRPWTIHVQRISWHFFAPELCFRISSSFVTTGIVKNEPIRTKPWSHHEAFRMKLTEAARSSVLSMQVCN
jgi:hypothetical protein